MPTSVHKSKQRLDSRKTNGCRDPIRWYQHIHPDDKERWSIEAAEMFLSGTAPEICVPRHLA